MSSSTSTDPQAVPAVAGFEIERVLGRGPRATVYVATQTGLRRRVALKLYAPTAQGLRPDFSWPERPGVARLHAAGSADGRAYTASQLAPGRSLAARMAAGDITREEALALCDEAAETLAAIGVAHGALGAGNVLIDRTGHALLCDFGMAGVDASAEADERALAALRARCERLPSRVVSERRRVALGGFLALALVSAVVAVTAGTDPLRSDGAVPAPLPGTTVLGSTLASGAATTVGCDGRAPDGSTPRCAIVPLGRDGRPVAFGADGVIRRWTVRGASGGVFLQVARPAGGRLFAAASTQPQSVTGTGARAFATDVAVRRGDVLAIELRPGAGVGIVRGAGGATTARVAGALSYGQPRSADRTTAAALDGELQLRVEYVPGGRARPVPTLTGAAARSAPDGRRLAAGEHEYRDRRVRTFALVQLADEVAIDVLRQDTRLRRLTVAGADPRGSLSAFVREAGGSVGPYVIWRNPDGREVVRHYRATDGTLTPID